MARHVSRTHKPATLVLGRCLQQVSLLPFVLKLNQSRKTVWFKTSPEEGPGPYLGRSWRSNSVNHQWAGEVARNRNCPLELLKRHKPLYRAPKGQSGKTELPGQEAGRQDSNPNSVLSHDSKSFLSRLFTNNQVFTHSQETTQPLPPEF